MPFLAKALAGFGENSLVFGFIRPKRASLSLCDPLLYSMNIYFKHYARRLPLGLASFFSVLLLAACAMPRQPVAKVAAPVDQWQAPLPHEGQIRALRDWWQAQEDPALLRLQDAAQQASPNLQQALALIAQARASSSAAGAAMLPQVNAGAAASRGENQVGMGVISTVGVSVQASWEIDLVGANKVLRDGAQAQLQASQAQWHEARVSLAAEVAHAYFSARACQALADNERRISHSFEESLRFSGQLLSAGMVPATQVSLARAALADARARLAQQAAQCDMGVKALVALTALPESQVRSLIAPSQVALQESPVFAVSSIPAQTLAQRPDVFAAEREVYKASALVAGAQAQQWPRLTLGGSVAPTQFSGAGADNYLTTWSFGPLALAVPVFDAGQRLANIDAAKSNFESKVATYQARVRYAVREVEESLLQLQLNDARNEQAQHSLASMEQVFASAQARMRQGMLSGLELEEARRGWYGAQSLVVGLQWERRRVWVALYRAAGGGWDRAQTEQGPESVLVPQSDPKAN
jgi:NodT family efflux transporter outer membrane factor (OMF) lipoprotein